MLLRGPDLCFFRGSQNTNSYVKLVLNAGIELKLNV